MCGIVGIIGKDAENELFKMLKLLEYRGYDSSGIATLQNNVIRLTKAEGNVNHLKDLLIDNSSAIGIGHTRWATHGKPSIVNAHPHLSQNGKWAIVHNGIIENYKLIKQKLEKFGYSFKSETDSEIIAGLFQFYENLPLKEQIMSVVKELKGSFAITVLSTIYPGTLILAKKDSPLYVGKNEQHTFVSSDPIAFTECNTYYCFNDNEFAIVNERIDFYSFNGKKIQKKNIPNQDNKQLLDCKSNCHMLEEIHQSPQKLNNLCETYLNNCKILEKLKNLKLQDYNKIYIIGCGSAYHSGLMGSYYLNKHLKITSTAFIASEFKCNLPILDKQTLCIFVSQSGETADTIASLKFCKKKKVKCIAIVNSVHSTLAQIADDYFPICAGPEIAVASTKAFLNQCAVFYILSKVYSCETINKGLCCAVKNLKKLAKAQNRIIQSASSDEIANITNSLKNCKNIFFIGKGLDYIISCEGALKLKEISYINCNALPAGELKHGTIALIENNVYVIGINTKKLFLSKTINALNETASRNASTLLLTCSSINSYDGKVITLPSISTDLNPLITITLLWIISLNVSLSKGLNPDQPRNLAKSVTVE